MYRVKLSSPMAAGLHIIKPDLLLIKRRYGGEDLRLDLDLSIHRRYRARYLGLYSFALCCAARCDVLKDAEQAGRESSPTEYGDRASARMRASIAPSDARCCLSRWDDNLSRYYYSSTPRRSNHYAIITSISQCAREHDI